MVLIAAGRASYKNTAQLGLTVGGAPRGDSLTLNKYQKTHQKMRY